MVDSTNKGNDYTITNNGLNKDDKKQTQAVRQGQSDRENANGGKLQPRDSFVRDISDNQIAGAPGYKNDRSNSSLGSGATPKK